MRCSRRSAPFSGPTSRDAALERATPKARTIFKAYKTSYVRVMGLHESIGAMRARLQASWMALGPWSCFINLNPAELSSPIVFEVAGHKITFDDDGRPRNRHAALKRLEIIAKNPVACSIFFRIFIRAFVSVFFMWDSAKGRQVVDPACPCPFGEVLSWYFR